MERGIILIVPAFEKSRGGGHLTRCVSLVCDLRALGREAYLFLNIEETVMQTFSFNSVWRLTEDNLKSVNGKIELIILDRFQTKYEELNRWKEIAPVIGIDEGGSCRDSFDFLIDILPVLRNRKFIVPNISNPALLKLPPKPRPKEKKETGRLKILVTFGHEDSAGLGIKIARTLCGCNKCEITLLRGALTKDEDYIFFSKMEKTDHPDIKLINTTPCLCRHLAEYDLVITHYGITAFEALYMGVPVILASPTKYHEKLAKNAGFPLWEDVIRNTSHKGTKVIIGSSFSESTETIIRNSSRGDAKTQRFRKKKAIYPLRLHAYARDNCRSIAAKYGLDREGESLAALVDRFLPQVNRTCPVCGEKAPDRSFSRFTDRTYRQCTGCGIIFMDRTKEPPFEYEKEYFNESYKKQYGKTYLEDFNNIKNTGINRLKIIKSLMHEKNNITLLDIGCAYGPFLAAAKEAGFSPAGIDPAKDAVRYVQEELNIPVIQGFFPGIPFSALNSLFSAHCSLLIVNCVTLWYVIEHFQSIGTVLGAVKNILAPDGILAFSMPNFMGISGRSSLKNFLFNSPADHYTIWSPKTSGKILAMTGFIVKKTVISGHHPERFPFIGKYATNKKSLLYKILLIISKVSGLGDTFEVYAQKK
ncbi:MAG: methyltransferase domain-containing protein [Treponema sp.]|jgi:spore coat polysaccharide biosynthesis predicted glycosyltransferase SpsG/2-polyprenyl-3-methyl-5-hydroxy-6-metoxy-1,4-benzoquinol methylase|nr:methyltransferase domain-containing protein [Treponema sp.]